MFDRDDEIEKLRASLNEPLVVVFGLRRVGKSSLIKAVLNEYAPSNYFYIDLRRFEESGYVSYRDFVKALEDSINARVRSRRLLSMLSRIRGVSISGFRVSFSWGRDRVMLADILDSINDWAGDEGLRAIIVLDEAQELVKARGFNVLPVLAYAYDNLRNLTFIITGSEFRVFTKFLKLNDPESPLFGRAYVSITLKPFNEEQAVEFLRRGFKEHGIEFDRAEEVYEELGGNPGWLTLFGYRALRMGFNEALNETRREAVDLIRREICNFINEGRHLAERRYLRILEVCVSGCRWSTIKMALEAMEGRELNNSIVDSLIKALLDYSLLIKEGNTYVLPDKLMRDAVIGLRCFVNAVNSDNV
ncbi:AAA family ATPase [Vulcanisaeta distributa]|uniref:AAA family ATPase n=1 Tax=Vulcanisaeta distributa TaxID=164451 RepID=UPI000A8B9DD1|nr:ATP-binding protein [Vulcanisaeta distributa]